MGGRLAIDGMAAGNDGDRKYAVAEVAVVSSVYSLSIGGGNDKRGNKRLCCLFGDVGDVAFILLVVMIGVVDIKGLRDI